MQRYFLLLPLLLPLAAGAEIYRSVDEAGNVTYTDLPAPGAERAELPGLSTYEAPSYQRAAPGGTPGAQAEGASGEGTSAAVAPRYDIKILKPELNSNVRADGGLVEVRLDISPSPADAAHTIRYRLDEERVRTANREVFYLRNLNRGPHTLSVWVADSNDRAVSPETSLNFFLSRGADLFHPPPRGTVVESGVQQAPRAPMAPRAPRQEGIRQYGPRPTPSPVLPPTPPPPVALPQGN